jgi:Family of unknown function (DUF6941)
MNLAPVVKLMVLCEEARFEEPGPTRLNLYGLTVQLSARGGAFPMYMPSLAAVVALRDGRGTGVGQVVGLHADTGLTICRLPPRRFNFGSNPLQIRVSVFQLRMVRFLAAGAYTFVFRYDAVVLATQSFDVVAGQP